jgi:hypothetical protein
MPITRLPDPEPDFNSPGWHEDEFGSDLTPYTEAMSDEECEAYYADHEDEEEIPW